MKTVAFVGYGAISRRVADELRKTRARLASMPFWFASTGSNRFVEMEGGPAPGNPKTLAETALSIVPGIRNLSAIAVMP